MRALAFELETVRELVQLLLLVILGVLLSHYLRLLLPALLVLTDAVLPHQLVEGGDVVEDVDAAASVEVCGLQQPQIVAIEVAQGARQLHVVPLLEVERLELCALVVGVLFARRLVHCGVPGLAAEKAFLLLPSTLLVLLVFFLYTFPGFPII